MAETLATLPLAFGVVPFLEAFLQVRHFYLIISTVMYMMIFQL